MKKGQNYTTPDLEIREATDVFLESPVAYDENGLNVGDDYNLGGKWW